MSLPLPLNGIITPLITPLQEDLSLDQTSLKKIIEHVIAGGVHGIFILGTTGEFSGLSYANKRELILESGKIIKGRIPLLVGISDCSFEESVTLAEKAKKSGADAVVATTPFYMNIGQSELVNYYKKLADSIRLPLFLYNMPGNTQMNISAETAVELASHPSIIGIKDSSGDLGTFQAYVDALGSFPDFTVLVGPEEILAQTLSMGGHGGVTGGANLFPKLYVGLYEAFESGNKAKVKAMQEMICFLSEQLYENENYESSYLKGLKAAMSFAGLCQGNLALPLSPYSEEEKKELYKRYNLVKERIEI